ncbi:DUF5988 family protein [Streptosporangium saharense]|uniref:DUF5988 family protein n=1 Tax=Streptosporangium saharense TaxID=1706840 RepID=UPI003429D771
MPQSQPAVILRPNVVLRGGAVPSIPEEQRTRHVFDPSQPFTLPIANRYEHFEPTGETVSLDGLELRVMQWVSRTYVAE